MVAVTLLFAAEILLWPEGAPGAKPSGGPEVTRLAPPNSERVVSNVHAPSITPYLPANPSGSAVVIAPGGGHRELWSDHEGHNVAKWLADHGVAAFVLKYRLAREKESVYKIEEHSLDDTLKAIAVVRSRAAEWKINPNAIGVMGFSAGGELAALAAFKHTPESRPAFQVLVYPAIPKDIPHSKQSPPAFLVCGENDRQNISQGLPELYLAMKKAGASAELHVYAGVGHGFGLRPTSKGPVQQWVVRFHEWLESRNHFR